MSALFRQSSLIQRLLGLFTILFLAATHLLWSLPPSLDNPQIPWFSWAINIPFDFDRFCLICLGIFSISLICLPGNHRWRKEVLVGYFACLCGLILLDQHRLQPWTLQFLLTAAVLSLGSETTGLRCCRWIVLTIYFYSAVSKFDFAFLATHGQLLLNGLCQAIDINNTFWPEQTRKLLATLFPVGEMIVVLLLLSPRTWRWGIVASWGMHVSILLAVGPLGLDHENGVLLWNIYFMAQNLVLFRMRPDEQPNDKSESASVASWSIFAIGITLLFAILPLFENLGWYDHWPAWAVYSSRPEKVTVMVTISATEDFPEILHGYYGPPILLSELVEISLDRWAFKKRKCPAYPQLRYRLALARALLRDFVDEDEITIKIQFSPNRWTGKRETARLRGWSEFNQQVSTFWLNTEHRTVPEVFD